MKRWLVLLAACSSPPHAVPDGPGAAGDTSPGSPDASRGVPHLGGSSEVCKLLNNRNISDPTPNDVQHRANLLGADLGISVDNENAFYIFFGDSIGYAGIWGNGQSHPDAVGYSADPTATVIADPQRLCAGLSIDTLPPASSVGPTVDSTVHADFAAGAMAAPAGHTLDEFIHNPAGPANQRFTNLPGDFEVPSGAFAYHGAIYIFYTTVVSSSDITMKGSYLARWAAPSPTSVPAYDILYALDERFDGSGPLHGDFVNIAAEVREPYVYLFGTGAYRASPVHLARKLLNSLDTPGGFELYDAATRTWVAPSQGVAPLFGPAGFGETSVRYLPGIDRWMFLGEELLPTSNRIVARFADAPEGPWSDEITVHDMADAAFSAHYCCAVDNQCDGDQFMNCDRTGFYGSYLLPGVQTHSDGSFTVSYTLSSFDPYDVALFTTTFTP